MSSPVVSVAGSSSAAAAGGSVIDVSSLVSQLVTATRSPQDAIISQKTQAVTTQISALGTLKGALSSFQSSLGALDTPDAFNTEAATSSDSTIFTASAASGAVAGTYSISVTHLAQAQQVVSKQPLAADSSTAVGTGTLQISLGSTSFNVSIDATNDTAAGIAAAINSAAGNPGVAASVINGSDGPHLVLSSTLTGAANTISVAETDSGNALAALTYDADNTGNYTEESAAQDASFTISGITHTSSSNTVTDALSGVTLNLTGESATGTSASLTVSSDTATIESNIANFVSNYNSMQSSLASLGSYDSTTGTAGPMLGDALLSGVKNQLRSALYGVVNSGSSTYNSLASIGITTNSDGSLSLNKSTLQTALTANFSAVSAIFSSTGGVASQLNTQITAQLADGGVIGSRSTTLISQENALTKQTNTLNDQMTALTAQLTQQYSALNTLLSQLQTTSAYLTQAFAALPSNQQNKNG